MLSNNEFWVLLGFVIFIAACWKAASRAISSNLDGRAAKIRAQLDEAGALRREAEVLMAEGEQRKAAAIAESRQVRESAEIEAKRLIAESEQGLKLLAERRQKTALDKIAEAEASALAEVRRTAVAVAIAATRAILERQVPGAVGDRIVDQAIAELPATLNRAA